MKHTVEGENTNSSLIGDGRVDKRPEGEKSEKKYHQIVSRYRNQIVQ